MWRIDTPWFDVALIMTIFAIGSILFGRFEEHKARGRRVLKLAIVLGFVVITLSTAGRVWIYLPMGVILLFALWAHVWWLPSHGINGWTAEPRDKYLALVEKRRS